MKRPLRVLVSAYACEPDRGSEPYVGWTWIHAIAGRVEEVHVLTRANNRLPIERAMARSPVRNLHFHYFDGPSWVVAVKNKIPYGEQLYYIWWQRAIGRLAVSLHARHRFDAVHHLTFAGLLCAPGVRRVNAPLIWGPFGLVRSPACLRNRLHLLACMSDLLHGVLRLWVSHSSGIASALRDAAVVLRIPTDLQHGAMAIRAAGRVVETGNVFIDSSRFPVARVPEPDSDLRLVSLGRLIYWKGLDLGMDALAVLRSRGIGLSWTIVGDGPERKRLQRQARALGLEECVRFTGWLPRDRALAVVREADLILHPAYREGVGAAILEGMALGLPVVCLDWGGPSFVVDQECGVKVPVEGSRDDIVRGLALAVENLADPSKRKAMSEAARRRVVERFSLGALDRVVEEVYGQIIG